MLLISGRVLYNPSPLERSLFAGKHVNAKSHSMDSYEIGARLCWLYRLDPLVGMM